MAEWENLGLFDDKATAEGIAADCAADGYETLVRARLPRRWAPGEPGRWVVYVRKAAG